MRVIKFGGTSVGSPERMSTVAELTLQQPQPVVVVLSAVSGTTNALVEMAALATEGRHKKALIQLDQLQEKYLAFVPELLKTEAGKQQGNDILKDHFGWLERLLSKEGFGTVEEKEVLAQGELLSTRLFSAFLKERDIKSTLLPALDFMRIDQWGEPEIETIRELVLPLLGENPTGIYITQGYICRNHRGEIDNLRRGGSDYTASLVGAALRADEVQIWTDISGMHNNDPRVVANTKPLAHMSFDEAAELAYFGAKILHPSSILPAQKYNIPVRLLNTMKPQDEGTLISGTTEEAGIRAIAAKDGITAVKIRSGRMLMAYGFLRRVFEVFEQHRTPIDMITTSEVAVSLTIDDATNLDAITKALEAYGTVDVDREQTIICMAGYNLINQRGKAAQALEAVQHLPVRMISYGGSRHNLSLLIPSQYKTDALQSLHRRLFTE
ncbi:aspartate kinase [Cesiribacter sp. SM1]|uniref:aspartate kinase n=1 Tax=Cesiribacter sp. SM1 TaxID=2861196 RepID=UPI001CD2E9AD|nr:aspartate kinase [Cesiribacter sp. SM1]